MKTIEELKKVDLHCHLDGSLPMETVKRLGKRNGIPLPADDILLTRLRAPLDCSSLQEYLTRFELPLSCLRTKEDFAEAVYDVMEQAALENTIYMEIRFAPMLSVTKSLACEDIIAGAADGLRRAEKELSVKGGLILCGMRHMDAAANVRLVEIAGNFIGAGVCAVDLAGDEAAFPVGGQKAMFAVAKKKGIPYTIHAGECHSIQSIYDAIELGASRIGHGVAAAGDEALMKLLSENRIALEMCPVSNLQTKAARSMDEYPFWKFYQRGIPVTVNTDNRTVSHTSITKELKLLQEYFPVAIEDMELWMRNALAAAFMSDSTKQDLLNKM